jgi:restriction system protein
VPIPDYQTIMLPFLRTIADGEIHPIRDTTKLLAAYFKLTEDELAERLPSDTDFLFRNRVAWARTYLKKAGLIETVARGQDRISPTGKEVLKSPPSKINVGFLKQFAAFSASPASAGSDGQEDAHADSMLSEEKETPREILEDAYRRIKQDLEDELLQTIRAATPAFFERLVVDLLVAMGYGGSLKDAGQAVGKSGDNGVDGIIKEDRLGLDALYIQAKKWTGQVGRPDVQAFAGSLEGHRARKGVFITTSQFSKEAQEYVTRIEKRIVLIDGKQLAQFMVDFGVGVTADETYVVKKLDPDYFEE